MALRYLEFVCRSCGQRFEFLAQGEAEIDQRVRPCDYCEGVADKVISAPGLHLINKKNSDFFARNKPRMKKRTRDHWNRQGKAEAIDREREQLKKYIEPA